MNKTLLFLLIINTLDLYTMENECLLCELTKQEAYEQRFPVIEKTEHWTVAINILSQLRGSVLLIPSRCIKSFADLLPAELETYRNLIIKYQDLLHQDTKLGAFNTGWQEDSHHIYVECAVRSPNDAGAIKALLQRSVATRNPRIFYRKMCELQNIPQEEIADRTSGETDSTTLPSFKFFDKRDKDPRRAHHFDSSDRETHMAAYTAPTQKKKPTECFFCKDIERGIDAKGSPLVHVEDHACACVSIGSYADPHLLYFPKDHHGMFSSLSRKDGMAFLEMNQKCLWVLQRHHDKLGTYLPQPATDSFIQEGVGSGATVPIHLHGQVVLETEPPEGIVATYYDPKKPKRDLGKIRTILRKGFEEEFSHH